MHSNKLHGSWDQLIGVGRELWGEIIGDEKLFSSGLRQRMIGQVESYQDKNYADAVKQVDQLMQ